MHIPEAKQNKKAYQTNITLNLKQKLGPNLHKTLLVKALF